MSSETICTCPETIAMASVPSQNWCEPYDYETALKEGTIFPCLNLTFFKADEGQSTLQNHSPASTLEEIEREKLMSKIDTISFAINDLTLYLDTHPDCQNGLPLFKELLKKRLDLLAEFASRYYPLTQISIVTGDSDCNCYGWGEGPMPWEGGCI